MNEKILVSKEVKDMWLSRSGESVNIKLFGFGPKITIKINNLNKKWKEIIKNNKLYFAYDFNLTIKEEDVIEKYENSKFIRIKDFQCQGVIEDIINLNYKKEIERQKRKQRQRQTLMLKMKKYLNAFSASDLVNKAIEYNEYIFYDRYGDETEVGYLNFELENEPSWIDSTITIGPISRNDNLYFGNVDIIEIKDALEKEITFEKYLLITKDDYFTENEVEQIMLKFYLKQDKVWLFSKMSLIMEWKYNIYKLHQHFKMESENKYSGFIKSY